MKVHPWSWGREDIWVLKARILGFTRHASDLVPLLWLSPLPGILLTHKSMWLLPSPPSDCHRILPFQWGLTSQCIVCSKPSDTPVSLMVPPCISCLLDNFLCELLIIICFDCYSFFVFRLPPVECNFSKGGHFDLYCSLLSSWYPERCLAHSRHFI